MNLSTYERGFINMSMENMVEQLIREKELERSGNIATGHEQVKVNWGKTLVMNLVGMRGSSVSVGTTRLPACRHMPVVRQ